MQNPGINELSSFETMYSGLVALIGQSGCEGRSRWHTPLVLKIEGDLVQTLQLHEPYLASTSSSALCGVMRFKLLFLFILPEFFASWICSHMVIILKLGMAS